MLGNQCDVIKKKPLSKLNLKHLVTLHLCFRGKVDTMLVPKSYQNFLHFFFFELPYPSKLAFKLIYHVKWQPRWNVITSRNCTFENHIWKNYTCLTCKNI